MKNLTEYVKESLTFKLKNFGSPDENDQKFDNFNFANIKLGEQVLPFANYEEDGKGTLTRLYNWYTVDVIWLDKKTETIIIQDKEGNYSPWEFNNNDGFKLMSEDAETIWDAFEVEEIVADVPEQLREMENFTADHIRTLAYNE